ncbi:MAG TPA: DICT sensory domain-containing protein, partial [Leptolyngbyaceae cyanobacterium]
MNLTPPLDFSLYQLALDTLTSPQSLSVSPTTLKSLVGAMIDVLIEEQIPVTLWVKLPPIEGWLAELKRYQQQVDIPKTIYLCSSVGDDLEEVTDVLGQAADANANSQMLSVQLTARSQLEQEYFLILLSDQFSSLIVAYQPGATATAGEGQSQPLQAVCRFERQVIQRVLEGIRGVIAVADTTPNQLLSNWETLSSQLSTSDEKALLTQLLVKQVQRTEEMLHSHNPSNSLV